MVDSDLTWSLFHQDLHTFDKSRDSCKHHKNREEEGADRIDNQIRWLVDNDDSSDNNTYGLQKISYQVHECRLDIDIFVLMRMVCMFVMIIVVMVLVIVVAMIIVGMMVMAV